MMKLVLPELIAFYLHCARNVSYIGVEAPFSRNTLYSHNMLLISRSKSHHPGLGRVGESITLLKFHGEPLGCHATSNKRASKLNGIVWGLS